MKSTQKKFRKWTAIKRNKDIYDIDQIDIYESMQEKQRRTPYTVIHNSELSDKFNESFMNSTTIFSCKLDSHIKNHKTKVGGSMRISKRNSTTVYTESMFFEEKQPLIKGISMEKMISREYRESLDTKQDNNDSRFNNFQLMSVDQGKTRRFDKYLSREKLQKLRMQTVPASNPQVPLIYEKFNYPSNTFNVNWQYKRQKWDRGPIFFKLNKENSANLNELKAENIEKGKEVCQAKWNRTLANWKLFSSKDEPSQFERTYYPPNMNFRTKKKKEEHQGKSIKLKFHNLKEPQFERWQLCDVKYFRLKQGKERKKIRVNTQ